MYMVSPIRKVSKFSDLENEIDVILKMWSIRCDANMKEIFFCSNCIVAPLKYSNSHRKNDLKFFIQGDFRFYFADFHIDLFLRS